MLKMSFASSAWETLTGTDSPVTVPTPLAPVTVTVSIPGVPSAMI